MRKRPFHRSSLLVIALMLSGCGQDADAPVEDNPLAAYLPHAQELTRSLLIVDTHVDVPYRLEEEFVDISQATEDGDFDYPRAIAGGLNAPFMSIYIPSEHEEDGDSKLVAERLIKMVEDIVANAPDKFAIVRSPEEVRANFAAGKISLPMGMENGSPIEGDLENLQYFYDRGIRYITLTHSKSNHISDSSYDEERRWNGLSDFGKEVVQEMNRLGIMVDVSHLSDEAFYEVMEISSVPVIASHSSPRHFTPGWERNMDDDMIRKLAEHGGVIQINFGSSFLTAVAQQWSDDFFDARTEYFDANGLDTDSPESDGFRAGYRAARPFPYAELDDVLDAFDHAVEVAGIDHVGVGSDFDGVGDSLPEGLKDVSDLPNLVAGLLARGYTEQDIEKILSGNLMRVWSEVQSAAEEFQTDVR